MASFTQKKRDGGGRGLGPRALTSAVISVNFSDVNTEFWRMTRYLNPIIRHKLELMRDKSIGGM